MSLKWCGPLAVAVLLAACGGDDKDKDQKKAARPTAKRDSVVRKPVYPEPEAAQIFRVLNDAEIATARVARERSQNADILRFASVMIADHRAMSELLDSLLPPIPDSANPESRKLREATTQMVDSMWKIAGGFNNTYIEHQVREHERALLLLDTALIPSARTPKVKQLLQDLRPAVVAHLQRAKQIYAARMASGMGETPRPATTAATTAPAVTAPAPTQPVETQPAPPPTPKNSVPVEPVPPPTTTSNDERRM